MKAAQRRGIRTPFYEPGYIPTSETTTKVTVDLANPKKIYEFLTDRVYKQDPYCKDAAMILYNHLRGITSRNIVCGPSGCGKTLVWQSLKEIWPRILFVDSSTLTKAGWKGNDLSAFLKRVDPVYPDYIIVFDEFDKCVAPQFTSYGEDVSANLQSEFLKLLEGAEVSVKDGEQTIDTSKMSFVLCGSFGVQAQAIRDRKSASGLGFGSTRHEAALFEEELSVQDVIDYGVIPELASRVTRIINVRPLTLADYRYLIVSHPASPVRKLEETYGIPLVLPPERIDEIAKNAYESGLGIRNVTSQLQQIIDRQIFDSFTGREENTKDTKPANRRSRKVAVVSGKPEEKGENHAV